MCAHFPTERPGVGHPGAASAMQAPPSSERPPLGSPGQGLAWSSRLWPPAPLFSSPRALGLRLEEPVIYGVQPDLEGIFVSDTGPQAHGGFFNFSL